MVCLNTLEMVLIERQSIALMARLAPPILARDQYPSMYLASKNFLNSNKIGGCVGLFKSILKIICLLLNKKNLLTMIK